VVVEYARELKVLDELVVDDIGELEGLDELVLLGRGVS